MRADTSIMNQQAASPDLSAMDLPPLGPGRRWQVREFLNDELQAYEPGTRVVFFVEAEVRVLGLPLRWHDSSYPQYVIEKSRSRDYFEDTARLMVSQHQEYVHNHNDRAL